MKNEPLDFKKLRTIKRRKFLYGMAVNVGLGALALKLWDMQVLKSDDFQSLSKINRTRIKLIAAPRGTIYDDKGVVLATNLPSYNIVANLESLKNIDQTLNRLAFLLNENVDSLKQNIKISKAQNPFFPAIVKSNVEFETMTVLNSFKENFAGVEVEYDMLRDYPLAQITSHLIGFINPSGKSVDKKLYRNKIASMRKTGQSGVEGAYNQILTGEDGFVQNEVNSSGLPIRFLNEKKPNPGKDIRLTINSDLQSFIYNKMPENGAVIVMEAKSGNIIAMVSKPGFDPNNYVSGISAERWKNLNNPNESSLTNRCLRGLYSPGSTFKMLIGLAALDSKIIDKNTEINCPGYFKLGRYKYNCWREGGHGPLNIEGALEQSCNVFFYNLGNELGIHQISQFAKMFGFGQKTGIDIPHELSGKLPNIDDLNKNNGKLWMPGETINISIGQGALTVSPLQNIHYLNAIINDGRIVKPNLVNWENLEAARQKENQNDKDLAINLNKNDTALIKQGLQLAVNSKDGTGIAAKSAILSISGKTGTTQVISENNKKKIIQQKGELDKKFKNHAWFLGYVTSNHLMPKKGTYSISVLLEHADKSHYAARFAKDVMEYFARTT